jgi:flagellar biosynthetic protein FliP
VSIERRSALLLGLALICATAPSGGARAESDQAAPPAGAATEVSSAPSTPTPTPTPTPTAEAEAQPEPVAGPTEASSRAAQTPPDVTSGAPALRAPAVPLTTKPVRRPTPARVGPPGDGAADSIDLPRLGGTDTAQALRIVLGLTLLAVLPALLVCLTPFLRSIIVLSMLRHGIGMNETPPNTVLIGLALFLTLFTMSPVLQRVNQEALQPFMEGKLSMEGGYQKGMVPLREFMVRQTREQDLALMVELSKAPQPRNMGDVGNVQLIPAYMLSELRAAFQIGFVVLLPFLLIDLVVSAILMSLGMMMMPPVTISLPLKVLMFVLVDGWSLLVKALVGSFN